MSRRTRAFLLASAFAFTGCSVGVLHGLGDKLVDERAEIVASTHPESGVGEVLVYVESDDAHKLVSVEVPESCLPYKSARLGVVVDKQGPLADARMYHRVELEVGDVWQEVGEVEGFSRPPSTTAKVAVGLMLPIAIAFDVAFLPIEIWAAVFVEYVLPKHAFDD